MVYLDLLLNYETKLSALKDEINRLIEHEELSSEEVYKLSVKIDKIINDYYKNYHQCI